ncbi:MAG: hypothetical protein DJ555_02700 [Desulfurococcaceae archaeon]|jgi:hypothetical protein|nr:MAG: hypothetical protein DJ555_02700 [Desulfurococcaceae archaeon]
MYEKPYLQSELIHGEGEHMSWEREKRLLQAAAMLIMLTVIGSAVAMWSDSLKVMVTVNTGDVDVEFSPPSTSDTGIDPGYDKDVGACYANLVEIENEDEGNPTGNNDLDLNITIVNGYPSYNCTVTFDVTNVGTIPVKGPHITIVSNNLGNAVSWTHNMTEIQIDPGQSVWFWISFHIEQAASENAVYTLQLKLMFHQWNEEPAGG